MKLSDKEGLRKVLSNAIPLLCQSGLPKETTFRIDAMIGITIDDHESSTLICFSEQIGPNKQPNIMSLLQNDSQFASNDFVAIEDFSKNENFNNNSNTDNTNTNFNSNSDFNCVNEDDNSNPIEGSIEANNIDTNNNDENKDTNRKRKRPRKSKPYSNTQLSSYNIKEEEEDDDVYAVKQENEETFQDNENVEWNNADNINNDKDIDNNNDNGVNTTENTEFDNNNNNQIDNNNNFNNTNNNNNNFNNDNNNVEQQWTNNNTQLIQPPPSQDRKTRVRRASRKYADYLSETLPLEASTYLEQHSSILSTSLNNLTNDLNSKDHDTDYNNLMQGICDFVMSQSQHIDDKNRPRSRTCHICQATLSNPLSLKNHIQGTHLALKLRRCNLCGETFKWTMQLARHKKRVHGSTDVLYNIPNGPVNNSLPNGTVANGGGGYSVE